MEGKKNDTGKLRWGLVPWESMEQVVRVLMYGADKYGVDNWRHVDRSNDRYWDAALRHMVAWRSGDQLDSESGVSHLAHAACCLLFLLSDKTEFAGDPRKWPVVTGDPLTDAWLAHEDASPLAKSYAAMRAVLELIAGQKPGPSEPGWHKRARDVLDDLVDPLVVKERPAEPERRWPMQDPLEDLTRMDGEDMMPTEEPGGSSTLRTGLSVEAFVAALLLEVEAMPAEASALEAMGEVDEARARRLAAIFIEEALRGLARRCWR